MVYGFRLKETKPIDSKMHSLRLPGNKILLNVTGRAYSIHIWSNLMGLTRDFGAICANQSIDPSVFSPAGGVHADIRLCEIFLSLAERQTFPRPHRCLLH